MKEPTRRWGAAVALTLTLSPASVPGSAAAQQASADGAPAPGTVRGRVIDAATQLPVAAASVEVRFPGRSWFVVTDQAGAYRVAGLPPGATTLVARGLGLEPLQATVDVPQGREVELDLVLEARPVVMPGIFAWAAARRLPPPGDAGEGLTSAGETELRALEATPGVVETGLTLSGEPATPEDPASVLYVRGAASDLKLVLLDGAPVYAPFHLSGILDAFPEGVLDDASLYIGGTPARYDGGLSYVLDLKVREGAEDRFRLAGTADVLGAGMRVEGPAGPSGRVLGSARGLHGLGYPVITDGEDLPYQYGDALLRLDHKLGPGTLSGTGFWNRESVLLNVGPFGDQGAVESAYWGNLAGSANYRVPLANGNFAFRAAYGRFDTGLPLQGDKELDPTVSFAEGLGSTARTRWEALFESHPGKLGWAAGGGFDTHETRLDHRSVLGGQTAHEVRSTIVQSRVAAAWGETIWRTAPAVELRTGFRASYFSSARTSRFAPRATVTWHAADAARLRLSAGRFFQVVRGPETILSGDLTGPTVDRILPLPDSAPMPIESTVAGASHVVVGLENDLENGLGLGVEGYFKSFEDLPGATPLYASGGDLWVQAREGPVRGWIGYSIAWVWTSDPAEETPFQGRQLLSGGLFADVEQIEFGVRLAYGAGLPFASVTNHDRRVAEGDDELPALSGAPEDSYLRLDAEVSRRWVATVGRSPLVIAPYVRLLNALDRRDALFYQAGAEETVTRPAPLATMPLIAVVGIAWTF